jgi:integrase
MQATYSSPNEIVIALQRLMGHSRPDTTQGYTDEVDLEDLAEALSGLNMHRARHTFATDLRRVADLGATSQALGHSDLSTTAAIYGHYDLSDLERAMEALARSRRQEAEGPDD